MEASSTVATWLSLAATVIGLGSIATQFGTIIDQADPFHSLRDRDHLGKWLVRQPHIPWYQLMKPPPVGPVIVANLIHRLCGRKTVDVSRLPLTNTSKQASWSVLLAVVQPTPQSEVHQAGPRFNIPSDNQVAKSDYVVTVGGEISRAVSRDGWVDLELQPLVKDKMATCTVISRTTLMALLCVTNARLVFRHSGASGHRAAYASYCGQWHIEWPIGHIARVHFSAHDSHFLMKDVYPRTFERRVDKCLQMLAGVIDAGAPSAFRCAFPGRKLSGEYILQYTVKGFGGAHGGRHLYNMLGGNVNEVDFLLMKRFTKKLDLPPNMTTLLLPNNDTGEHDVILYVPEEESVILSKVLDCLPWSPLSWSIHRGLRDILVAFAKERMDRYRDHLAESLRRAVQNYPERLDARGWDYRFVRESMADMATSAVLAGSGNSGDMVRIVTDIALTLWNGALSELDATSFWRYTEPCPSDSPILDPMAVVALVKCFVLEWSVELDYQMYHDFPLKMYLG
ncbi:hypothetical protein BJX61DRAFT_191812 [Aspergillus egyptiacus]|nr:hypothetical protein BJX61DRAFT_191812 [Aspergillus egyptiacus]